MRLRSECQIFGQEAGVDVEQLGKVTTEVEAMVGRWVRDSLAHHCLGSHLLDLFRNHTLLEAWYSRQASLSGLTPQPFNVARAYVGQLVGGVTHKLLSLLKPSFLTYC